MSFAEQVAAANQHLTNTYRNQILNARDAAAPRFELYHSAPSLCSMKCRTVMAEKGIAYYSHDLNIRIAGGMPENYLPDYVRLRLLGAPQARFVNGYTGQSSVTTEGFDPCVVPTLVDHEKESVIVDSSRICAYLDAETDHSLVPDALANEIGAQISLVDQAPHVAALYGAHPDGDDRPMSIAKPLAGVHAKKAAKLELALSQVSDEPLLVEAYRAKM
ncbi:MAG: glutathione S-transferase N-terminal domain-containing protein, partial [Pseudomonadota bacterium]